jgi:CrcB protein
MIKKIILAGLGGFIGTVLRALIYQVFKNSQSHLITLFINISGSLLIGILAGIAVRYTGFNSNWKTFLTTGICGGFTTFSAFSLENTILLQEGKISSSIAYILLSVLLGICASIVGYKFIS